MNAKALYTAYGLGKAAGPTKNPEEYSNILAALDKAMAPSDKAELCMLKAHFANTIAGAAPAADSCGGGTKYGSALEALEGTDSELAYVYVRKLGLSKADAQQVLANVPNWPEKLAAVPPKPKPKPSPKTPAKAPDPKTPALPAAVAAKPSAVNAKTVLLGVGLLLAAIGVGTLALRSLRTA